MKKILFSLLVGISLVSQSCINDNEDPVAVSKVDGAIVNPNVGGATEPNQVWFDLGTETETINKRTDWDLAFYSGNEFKVVLNSSIMMAAGKISGVTDIDLVKESDVTTLMTQVQVANFNPANVAYIDDVNGNFPSGSTVIEEVRATDSENGIYLLNMGNEVYAGSVATGSVTTSGDSRGWMKIQVVRSGDGYTIKYAALNATGHKTLTISKNTAYNFNFVSLVNSTEVFIQPEKKKWDICFTVFTNTITSAGSYVYADFVNTNIMGGVGAYQVTVGSTESGVEAYNNFTASDIDQSKFVYTDQRVIGSNWRNPVGTNGLETYGDRFYVIKDAEGYYFKIRFTRMTSTDGERGRPQFEYKPL